MPHDEKLKVQLPKPWPEFLKEVDNALSATVHLHCIGGFAATIVYGIPRVTGDLDYVAPVTATSGQEIEAIAGKGSKLAAKHYVCVQAVGLADLPEDYADRLKELSLGLKHLHIWVVDLYDLLLSKLMRNSPKDREDAKFLIQEHQLSFEKFYDRWKSEMSWVANAKRHEEDIEYLWKDYFAQKRGR